MFKAPAFAYGAGHTDFLLVRQASGRMVVRQFQGTLVLGQLEPHVRVPAPQSKEKRYAAEPSGPYMSPTQFPARTAARNPHVGRLIPGRVAAGAARAAAAGAGVLVHREMNLMLRCQCLMQWSCHQQRRMVAPQTAQQAAHGAGKSRSGGWLCTCGVSCAVAPPASRRRGPPGQPQSVGTPPSVSNTEQDCLTVLSSQSSVLSPLPVHMA